MIDKKVLLNKLNSIGNDITEDELDKKLDSIDREDLEKQISSKYELKLWDKKSKINNIDAETILNNRDYEIDAVYLVYIDKNLIYFQDYNPNESGHKKMTKDEAQKIGADFIQKKIENNVDEIIYSIFLENKFSK
jgi:hypothetical protein